MKCIYRGHAYEVSAPVQPSVIDSDQPSIKLIYRGQTYDYTPPTVVSERVEAQGETVTLIYRGHTYQRQLCSPRLRQLPHAINWRYQTN